MSWEVLTAAAAACLRPVAREVSTGARLPDRAVWTVSTALPLRLPASGGSPVGPRSPAPTVCVQELSHQVLQVPQDPARLPAEGQPPAWGGGEGQRPVRTVVL